MLCCGVVLCVAVSLLTQTSGTQPWLVRKRDVLANDAIVSDTDLTLAFRSHAVALCSHHRWCAHLPVAVCCKRCGCCSSRFGCCCLPECLEPARPGNRLPSVVRVCTWAGLGGACRHVLLFLLSLLWPQCTQTTRRGHTEQGCWCCERQRQ